MEYKEYLKKVLTAEEIELMEKEYDKKAVSFCINLI